MTRYPLVVAEIELAHMGRMDYAKRLVDAAEGANAVKFQIYKTDELIDKSRDPARYARFKERQLSYEQFAELKEYTENRGFEFIATPHTVGAFEFLKSLGVATYKIGSGDRGELLPLAIDTGKKVFVSTGIRSHSQILKLVQDYGNENVTFMHCITMYPVLEQMANLGFMKTLDRWCRRSFANIGYSDHLPGIIGCEIATALGATVIEKHIRLPESKGQDNLCALDAWEFNGLCKKIKRIKAMLKNCQRIYSAEEKENESWALKKNGKRPYLS